MYIVHLIPETTLVKNIYFDNKLIYFNEGFDFTKFDEELFVKYDYYYESFNIYDRNYIKVNYTIELEGDF
jgi:hypothetical protein